MPSRFPLRFSPLLAPVLCCSLMLIPTAVDARREGGGGGDHGGGAGGHGGGGQAYRFRAPAERPADDRDLQRGYRGAHPRYGQNSRSHWTGHNISPEQHRRDVRGNRTGTIGWSRDDARRFDRRNNPEHNFYDRNAGAWNRHWANGGYWGSRPWGYGWYRWSPGSWSWWGGSAAAWGLTALASADVITGLVNSASERQSPLIDVPDSAYQLNYASVDAVGSSGADFSYAVQGNAPAPSAAPGPAAAAGPSSAPVKGAANCQEGLLDGQVPSTAAQAQLLNAACQVAYGPDPKGTPLPDDPIAALPGWLRDGLLLALGGGLAVGGVRFAQARRR